MAVQRGTAFSLHQIMMDKLKPSQATVEAHPDTAATGHFLPVGCKGKPLPDANFEVICTNSASMHSIGG
jgi:hypothetical protein